MSKPTFLFIPGAWHTPWHYSFAVHYLNAHGYESRVIPNLSNHDDGPWPETWEDDIANIRAVLCEEFEVGHEVILVMHSYGGGPGGAACKNLLVPHRVKDGLKGGIREVVYVASFALDEGAGFGQKLEDPSLIDHVRSIPDHIFSCSELLTLAIRLTAR
jgi:pimeloyl-ACP methyl ester carboxylesterase